MTGANTKIREVIFISKATPGDDEFVLWLAPRLEAAGYTVYADILRLDPGMRWRQELTTTLQSKAIKMLLCCQDSSLSRNGVQEEIGIGPNWEQYRQRNAVQIKNEPESLTSNWLRVVEIPDTIRYFSPTGAVDH